MTRQRSAAGDAGFTLVELLVVVVLMGIIGAAITGVVTSTLQTSRTNSDVRGKLDQTRLAIERVREEVRGADEVCTHSDGNQVSIWTDKNRDRLFQAGEVTRFSVTTVAAVRQLQRQDGSEPVSAIVANVAPAASYFTYNIAPAAQSTTVLCKPSVTPTGPAGAKIATIDLTIPITARSASDPANARDMEVATSITLRNAVRGLVSTAVIAPPAANSPPLASFTFSCNASTCDFSSTSTDPDGGLLTQRWDLGDSETTSTQNLRASFSHTFPILSEPKTYTVTLHVRDNAGAVHSTFRNVTVTPITPGVMFISDLDDVSTTLTSTNAWKPGVEVETRLAGGASLSGATVTGRILVTGETLSCITGTNGRCRIDSMSCVTTPGRTNTDGCPAAAANTTFTVNGVTRLGSTYDPGLNSDPDADNSSGTVIELVNR